MLIDNNLRNGCETLPVAVLMKTWPCIAWSGACTTHSNATKQFLADGMRHHTVILLLHKFRCECFVVETVSYGNVPNISVFWKVFVAKEVIWLYCLITAHSTVLLVSGTVDLLFAHFLLNTLFFKLRMLIVFFMSIRHVERSKKRFHFVSNGHVAFSASAVFLLLSFSLSIPIFTSDLWNYVYLYAFVLRILR